MSTFPGMEQIIQFLTEQQAAEQAKFNKGAPRTPPSMSNVPQGGGAPSMSNIPRGGPTMSTTHQFPASTTPVPAKPVVNGPMSVGNAANTGKNVLGALGRGAARVAGPVGVGLALQPAASQFGELVGDQLAEGMVSEADYMSPERWQEKQRANLQAQVGGVKNVPAEMRAQGASQSTGQPAVGQPKQGQMSSSTKQSAQLAGLPEFDGSVGPSQVQPSRQSTSQSGSASAEQEADDFMQQVMATLEPQGAIQEEPNAQTEQDIADLTKPREGLDQKEPTSTLGKVGRGINKFLVSGAGPYDPTRYDRQQLDLKEKKQQFTPQEALRGQLAISDRQGRQQFNRQSQLEQNRSGGLTDMAKTKAGVIAASGDRKASRANKQTDAATEHGYRMAEIGASGAAQRETPGAQQAKVRGQMVEKYPDLFSPEQLYEATGLQVSPEALKVISDARLKNDPMAMAVSELLKQRLGNMGGAGKPAGNVTTNALAKKSEPAK